MTTGESLALYVFVFVSEFFFKNKIGLGVVHDHGLLAGPAILVLDKGKIEKLGRWVYVDRESLVFKKTRVRKSHVTIGENFGVEQFHPGSKVMAETDKIGHQMRLPREWYRQVSYLKSSLNLRTCYY